VTFGVDGVGDRRADGSMAKETASALGENPSPADGIDTSSSPSPRATSRTGLGVSVDPSGRGEPPTGHVDARGRKTRRKRNTFSAWADAARPRPSLLPHKPRPPRDSAWSHRLCTRPDGAWQAESLGYLAGPDGQDDDPASGQTAGGGPAVGSAGRQGGRRRVSRPAGGPPSGQPAGRGAAVGSVGWRRSRRWVSWPAGGPSSRG
jgi:hypothetical protein